MIDWLACYPGFLYIDSIDQFTQALHNQYTDWHPPIMAAGWRLLNYIYEGPQGMLAFQLLLLWTSFYMIATTWCHRWPLFVVLLLLFAGAPYVQNFAGLIVKDAQMALCWLLAVVIMLRTIYYNRKMRPWEAILTFLLITYGTMVRINALPGALALYYLWVEDVYSGNLYKRVGLLCLVLTGLLLTNLTLTKLVLKPAKAYPEYKLIAHDLAGIQVKTGRSYWPSFITNFPGFDSSYIRQKFTTATFDNIWWNGDKRQILPPLDESSRKILVADWKLALRENPGTYLSNRFDGFLYYLQLKVRPDTTFFYYYPYIYTNPYGFSLKKGPVFQFMTSYIQANEHMPYMKPWFWLLLPVMQLLLTLTLPRGTFKKAGISLSVSSLLYLLPQFFIFQADTEFRYFYWCCLSTTLHTILLFTWYYLKSKKDPHLLEEDPAKEKTLRITEGSTII